MKLSVFGTGYVGLVQGAVLAEVGHDVLCADIDAARVAALEAGEMPIYEPGLDAVVARNVEAGRLAFTTDAAAATAHGEVIFLAVGTPPLESGAVDLSQIDAAADAIADAMTGPRTLVTKSTVPVGTAARLTERLRARLEARGAAHALTVVANPEFLKEGAALSDALRPERIIIGTEDADALALMRELYAPFNRNRDRVLAMDPRSAELTKYAANAILATKISFMNEIALLAEQFGADIEAVRHGIGSDPRIGTHFIYAGAGYGGSCFPKDVQALIHTSRAEGLAPLILEAVEARNAAQKLRLFEKISAHYAGALEGRRIALWGLSFKPNTDDMRAAPSRPLIDALLKAGAVVQAYDPKAMTAAEQIWGGEARVRLMGTRDSTLREADALVLVTEWQEFKAPDWALVAERLRDRVVFDGRNLYDPATLARRGLTYYGIGRRG